MAGGEEDESPIAVYGALGANVAIAATKFTVAAITGSAALFAEGIHSAVDSANEILLLVGLHRAKKAPNAQHPFGHGKEIFYWGLVVAMVIFAGGGAVSIYEGILRLLAHEKPGADRLWWKLGVLGAAFVFESISLTLAIRSAKPRARTRIFTSLRSSRDPSVYTVIAEDSAALAGITVAAAGITLAHVLRAPWIDPAASIGIGLILCVVSVALAERSRSLLVGESLEASVVEAIRKRVRGIEGVVDAESPRTMQLGPDEVLVTISVDLHVRRGIIDEIRAAIHAVDRRIRWISVEAHAR